MPSRTLFVLVGVWLMTQAPGRAPAASTPAKSRARVVLVDDRAVKEQAPAAFLDRVMGDLAQRKGLSPVRLSAVRGRLAPADEAALAGCGDDAGCLATAARVLGADVVVLVRVTRREGEDARFVATTKINALRPQIQDDSGGIAGSERDALPLVSEQVAELFPQTEAH